VLRKESVAVRKLPPLVVDQGAIATTGRHAEVSEIVDERRRLILLCGHPALAPAASAALTLRLVGGLTVSEIAWLFLVTEPTMAAG